MEFTEILDEYLDLRDKNNNPDDSRSIPQERADWKRQGELAEEMNKRVRGEL